MRASLAGACLAIGALVVLPGMPPAAQEQSAQDLIDRIRQIQAEGQGAPPPSEQPEPATQGQSAQDLIDQIRQIQAGQQAEPAALQPDLGEDQMRAMVHESLGVEILRIEVVEQDGEPVYAITVVNPPGDRNDAFRVATLLFDGATGSLLGQQSAAPRADAPGLSTAPAPSGFESGGLEIRRRTWR
jgi:uncharacterized membrane protein YkoI